MNQLKILLQDNNDATRSSVVIPQSPTGLCTVERTTSTTA